MLFKPEFLFLTLSLFTATLGSGHHLPADSLNQAEPEKVRSLKGIFTNGKVEGHIRNYLMGTVNQQELSDHYANAAGARLGYHTAPYKGFRFGFAGLFTYNAFSSELAEPDKIAGKLPRYETELFDLEDPENKADLDRLDELYLAYRSKHFKATFGRSSFTSPLINPQDGRMKPYSVQGLKLEIPVYGKGKMSLAWFDHFSPRSTVSWFDAGEAIGIFSIGKDENGWVSGYKSNVHTKGVAVAGLQFQPWARLKTETWHYWLENISHTTYGRAVFELKPGLKLGGEGLFQQQSGNGGNPEAALAYFPNQQQWLASGMLAYEPRNWQFSANYLHLGSNGRFLFPREFGREQFFTTVSRGRLEGLGNADAVTLKMRRSWQKQLSAEIALTKTWQPSPQNFRLNKYGSEAYYNGLLDINYKPELELLQGFSFRFLYIARLSPGTELPLAKRFYNTNFHHFNLVTQLTF